MRSIWLTTHLYYGIIALIVIFVQIEHMYIIQLELSPMQKQLGLSEARGKLSEIINGVLYDRDTYIISKQGKPAAAVVPLDVLEQWQAERDRLFEVMAEVHEQNQDVDPDELMEVINKAQQAVRAETHTSSE